jgi:hypothetical protein
LWDALIAAHHAALDKGVSPLLSGPAWRGAAKKKTRWRLMK